MHTCVEAGGKIRDKMRERREEGNEEMREKENTKLLHKEEFEENLVKVRGRW